MTSIDIAEHDLSRALQKLNDTAQAAGYTPIWGTILGRLASQLPVVRPEVPTTICPPAGPGIVGRLASQLPVVHPEPPTRICPPAGQQFDCVSIPATALLLSSATTAKDVYVRPGRKPTPRQESVSPTDGQDASTPSASSKAAAKRRRRKHKRCSHCMTERSSGGWRSSVLGVVCPTLCSNCYGKEFRRVKKVSTRLPVSKLSDTDPFHSPLLTN
ncbi:hypothetical protein CF326_g7282 [Tilletia indica]|nr:hypothetical protein CF326_g7282 [Tilletia indica]